MAEALQLEPNDRVLEIGTGSGYAAAVLSKVAREVYTIERHQSLTLQAETRLKQLKYDNVHVLCGDGTLLTLHLPFGPTGTKEVHLTTFNASIPTSTSASSKASNLFAP